jgi:hypothetical protein
MYRRLTADGARDLQINRARVNDSILSEIRKRCDKKISAIIKNRIAAKKSESTCFCIPTFLYGRSRFDPFYMKERLSELLTKDGYEVEDDEDNPLMIHISWKNSIQDPISIISAFLPSADSSLKKKGRVLTV